MQQMPVPGLGRGGLPASFVTPDMQDHSSLPLVTLADKAGVSFWCHQSGFLSVRASAYPLEPAAQLPLLPATLQLTGTVAAGDFIRQHLWDLCGGSKSLHTASKQCKERNKRLKQPSFTHVSCSHGQMKQGRIKDSLLQSWEGSLPYTGRESKGQATHNSALCHS